MEDSVFGHIFTKNYSKIRTGSYFIFGSLTLQTFTIFFLVTYNFEQFIISRNYFS